MRPPKFSEELKAAAVQEYLETHKSGAEVCEEFGVSRQSLARWVRATREAAAKEEQRELELTAR